MESFDVILQHEDATVVEQCLAIFIANTGARAVLLVGRDGNLLAQYGNADHINIDSLCALGAGAFVSSSTLANLAGDDSFNSITHQGRQCNLFITCAGEDNLLLAIFDRRASMAMVRLQAKVTAEAVIHVLERVAARGRKARVQFRQMYPDPLGEMDAVRTTPAETGGL